MEQIQEQEQPRQFHDVEPCLDLPNCQYRKIVDELAELWEAHDQAKKEAGGKISGPEVDKVNKIKKEIDDLAAGLYTVTDSCNLHVSMANGSPVCPLTQPRPPRRGRGI
jgi:hypothetical protein